jgi:antagonist of KipI
MSLEVIDVSGLATIQDTGRKGWMRFGIPISGVMDTFAFHAVNALLGNSPGCAVVEIGMGDITFRALQDCVISIAGYGYSYLGVSTLEFLLCAKWVDSPPA